LITGADVGEYTDPSKFKPITHYIEPCPIMRQGYTVPIRIINKMGHN